VCSKKEKVCLILERENPNEDERSLVVGNLFPRGKKRKACRRVFSVEGGGGRERPFPGFPTSGEVDAHFPSEKGGKGNRTVPFSAR